MTEPTRVVARPPIGSENNQPTWTRHSLKPRGHYVGQSEPPKEIK